MLSTTLCLPLREGSILLGMKKCGFGEGRWNGMGGKVKKGENIEAATVRELEEEVGLRAATADLESCAVLDFFFDGKPEWDNRVHVFFIRKWEGEIVESDEMRPRWFSLNEIPFDTMWPDDRYWLPLVLGGESVEARFCFDNKGDAIIKQEIKIVGKIKQGV
jgi:8-oxo-dGTP pyrophosphatase MutT (NUDIX family)